MIVKLYRDLPESYEMQNGISGKIPAIVDFNTDTPQDNTWIYMTNEEYSDYLASLKNEIIEWKDIISYSL